MIEKYGKVEVTEDQVTVYSFAFRDVGYPDASIEALRWAKQRIEDELEKLDAECRRAK